MDYQNKKTNKITNISIYFIFFITFPYYFSLPIISKGYASTDSEERHSSREAYALYKLGKKASAAGQTSKAIQYFEKALRIWQSTGSPISKGSTLFSIGEVYSYLNQHRKALEHYEKALPFYQTEQKRYAKSHIFYNIANTYSALGQKQKALEYYEKALPICQSEGKYRDAAYTLNGIGMMYSALGQRQKALEYLNKALPILRKIKNAEGEAATLDNIAQVYYHTGRNQEALEYNKKSLLIWQRVGNPSREANTLTEIGFLYSLFQQNQKSMEYYEKALLLYRSCGNRSGETRVLNLIGSAYEGSGQKQIAMEYYDKALNINKEARNRTEQAISLNYKGAYYLSLRQEQKALEYFQKALPIFQELGSRAGEAKTLHAIGHVHDHLRNYQKAMEYYKKSLHMQQAIGDYAAEATSLNKIAGIYFELRQHSMAMQYLKKARSIFNDTGDRKGLAGTITNIGQIYNTLGQPQKAMEYYEKALPISFEIENAPTKAGIFTKMMSNIKNNPNRTLSVFYGKLAVNTGQNLRKNISDLDHKIKEDYFKSIDISYRLTASQLIDTGRLSEAQQILNIFKGEEYLKFIHYPRSYNSNDYEHLDFSEFEKKWARYLNTAINKLASISREYHQLKVEKKDDAKQKRLKELSLKLYEEQNNFEKFLTQMKDAFAQHDKEIKKKPGASILLKSARQLQSTLKYLDQTQSGKNVALHYLLYEGRISVIITTPTSQTVKQTEIGRKEFSRMILLYRNLVVKLGEISRGTVLLEDNSNHDYDALLQRKKENDKKLYEIIFKPVEPELKKYGATNLVLSLDGVLRYIPFSTLWDGQHYLLQRYRIALITPSSLKNINDDPMEEKKILGFGAGNGGQGFSKLPYVAREIRSIVRDEERGYFGLVDGRAFINSKFTRDAMIDQLKTGDSQLVHISSHFKFSPGDETKNKLLLGDGSTIKLSEIRKEGKLFDGVKLLVLSACETGIGGNGEEIDGFGEMAQQSGAKSVIASLWPVADESTKELMVSFYRNLTNGKATSKIEALRQAQLELAGLDDLLTNNSYSSPPGDSQEKKTKYPHSYYWGPFIMIGNWR